MWRRRHICRGLAGDVPDVGNIQSGKAFTPDFASFIGIGPGTESDKTSVFESSAQKVPGNPSSKTLVFSGFLPKTFPGTKWVKLTF
jgi:hypothetical protein